MTDKSSTVLNKLRTAHHDDWGLYLSSPSQEVHELWEDIEAKKIISSCIRFLSSQEVHKLEALVNRLIEAGDRLSDSLCTYPEEEKTIEVCNWNAIVAEYKEREEDALNDRIAELSQAVGLITTLKPTMVMDTEHPLDMAKEVVEYVTARIAELEAERLE